MPQVPKTRRVNSMYRCAREPHVVVIGGGFSGCAAAISAAKAGADVILLERTDMLLACGLRAGIVENGARFLAIEEMKALGAGEIFEALESITLYRPREIHTGIISKQKKAYVYDCSLVEPTVRRVVEAAGVEILFESRAIDVEKEDKRLLSVILQNGEKVMGNSFVDCTGNGAGVNICNRYGKGCVMCFQFRCPTFGDTISISAKAGASELMYVRPDGTPGAINASITIFKDTLSSELRHQLERDGAVTIPLPKALIDYSKVEMMSARPDRRREEMEHINLVNIGCAAKCVGIMHVSLKDLRKIRGFENAEIENPQGGGKFNSVRNVSIVRREDSLRVKGFENLFCAGDHSGPFNGLVEALVTGHLAGYNAARVSAGKEPLVLPRTTAIGDFIAYTGQSMRGREVMREIYSMKSEAYIQRIKDIGLCTTDSGEIRHRIDALGLTGVFDQNIFT